MLQDIFGRLHPLIVHLPIGILILAFVFEALSLYDRYHHLRRAVRPSLGLGFLASVFACLTGLILKNEGGYDADRLEFHQFLGLATTLLTLVVFFLRKFLKGYVDDPRRRKIVRIITTFILIIVLSITGHYGGTLTHGDDYLTFNIAASPEQPQELAALLSTVHEHDSLILYQDVIHPLLASRCFSCHSASRQKGNLRLDDPAFIMKGGKHGKVVVTGNADSSSMYWCLQLPVDHDQHMPPSEKPQLTSTDIALIQEWINAGASFDQRIVSLTNKDRIKKFLASYKSDSNGASWIPAKVIDEPDESAIATLRASGVIILPLGNSSNYLSINFTNARSFQNDWIAYLRALSKNVVWVDLSNCTISSDQIETFQSFENLSVLYLNHANIDDHALGQLSKIKSLKQVSLVGTKVTDEGVSKLKDLPQLTEIFLYGTGASGKAFKELRENRPTLQIDSGNYKLEKLVTDTIIYKRK